MAGKRWPRWVGHVVSRYCVPAERDDDFGLWVSGYDSIIHGEDVTGAISREWGWCWTDRMQHRSEMSGFIDVLVRQVEGDDLAAMGVNTYRQRAPGPAFLCCRQSNEDRLWQCDTLAELSGYSPSALSSCDQERADRSAEAAMIEPLKLSHWRSPRRNTVRIIRAVSLASPEERGWPPRVIRGCAFHPAIASSVNQMVKLAQLRGPVSQCRQFVTRCFWRGI